MSTPPLIQLRDVSFTYGAEPVLENVSLDVHAGEYLGVIGPNGGGKTTLLRTMLGLIRPTSGHVELFGEPVATFNEWHKIGYVPQKATNFDTHFPITVEEVVSLGRIAKAGLWRHFSTTDQSAITQALDRVGMLEYRRRLITELSGGQQQRVFIAKALAADPSILILDEPTVGIDIKSQDAFYQLLSRLNTDEGLTIVMVSHDIDVVVNEVTKIACINETLIYHGQPENFIKDDYVAKLYGKARKFILHGH